MAVSLVLSSLAKVYEHALYCRGGIRTMMVTGDYHHTAIAVARGVGMVPQGGQLVIIQAKSEKQVLPRMLSRVPPALGAFSAPARPYRPGPISSSCCPQRAPSPLLVPLSEQAKPSPGGQQVSSCEPQQSPPIEGQQSLSCEGQQMLSFEEQAGERRQRVCDGLTFMADSGNDFEEWDPHCALTTIAQVHHCTHAFALLLLQSHIAEPLVFVVTANKRLSYM